MEKGKRVMKIGELERLSGVPRHTIHQYLRHGLLPPPARTGRTMAYYDDSHLERLAEIKRVKGSARVPIAFLKRVLGEAGAAGKEEAGEAAPGTGKAPGEARRRQIREAAFRVFLEKGYQGARVQDITAAAGISTGAFYIYYRDKRDLFMDTIDELIRDTVAGLEEVAAREGDLLKATAEIARFYIDNYGYFSGIINQLRGLMASAEPSARDKFASLHNRMADPIVREIRAAVEAGRIRDLDPELLARALMGMVEFLAILLTFDDRYTTDQAVSFLVDLFTKGVGRG
ncbi:MAG: MerR family transcriptional regulator [Actinobacteria bacterium]|nr:MerR family transcriptional regulator [Actinomycetota bacterium]